MMNTKRCYIDQRGWQYRVMEGLGDNTYKARYHKPENHTDGWHCVRTLPWRDNIEDAQRDLDAYAKKHHMTEVESNA